MNEAAEKIPFSVEISRMIEVLAAQIYPSPFALLRENVQNSFDAILMRKHLGHIFEAVIDVTIEPTRVIVSDNGIGMGRDELRQHYWRAGSSSKNTPDARAAGVVGTFGIGAMANFGIAEELTVETESARTGERTVCSASRSTLSVTEECISFEKRATVGSPGTTVMAVIQPSKSIKVAEAETYIAQFVSFLPIEVKVNGRIVSRQSIEDSVPYLARPWSVTKAAADLGGGIKADVALTGALSGEVRVALHNIEFGGQKLEGRIVVSEGRGSLRTFRSGFGLATTNVSSAYNFGGVADFLFLQPTAGREALTTDSMQLLQTIVGRVDEFVSIHLAGRPESNASAHFVEWAYRSHRYDLCSNLRIRIEPGDSLTLGEARDLSQKSPLLVYAGTDSATVKHASADRPIVMLSRGGARNQCEIGYLRKYCKIEELSDNPKVLVKKAEAETTGAEKALSFRIASILSTDYFLESHIRFGKISHGLPVLVTVSKPPVEIYLDPAGATVRLILEVYDKEYSAFSHMAKDFVRTMIFPRVSELVPSATRQGAEAFLKAIHRSREVFEYETTDLESLTTLWKEYLNGKLTFQQATERSTKVAVRSYQVLDRSAAAPVREVVPDVIDNQAAIGQPEEKQFGPVPPIQRLDMSTERKLLTIGDSEAALKGYRCFLALTDRIWEEKGDFFLQPHRTSVVWGGQKALFIFEHHSGDFGLYYDLQTQNLISEQSGGGSFETCTIVMKNRIFIPIPQPIQASFLPHQDEKKRFEVRCDILHIDRFPED
ncbi:MAG: ATP-binding protein [Candidatus Acidiferrales bacterium]|jgi:molecular chaperone HtpG